MVTMVITPSQQGCRSRNQPLTLFTLTKDLLCLLLAILLATSPAAAQQGGERQLDETDMNFITYVNSCADLPNERTPVQGFVAFMDAIVCPSPKVCPCVSGLDFYALLSSGLVPLPRRFPSWCVSNTWL